jgi:uncharacterized protein YkwD
MKRPLLYLPACLVLAAGLVAVPFAWTAYSQQIGTSGAGRVSHRSPKPAAEDASRPVYEHTAVEISGSGGDRLLREITDLEHECFVAVNHERVARGLVALDESDELLDVARGYSRRMAEQGFFSHQDPDGKTVRERVREAGVTWHVLGENLGYSRGYVNPVAATVVGWMESPTHRKNILEPDFKQGAVGVWISDKGTVYFTEIFLKK